MTNNQVQIKKLLGVAEVRVVNYHWIVLKDLFDALCRVDKEGRWADEKEKMLDFLRLIGKETDVKKLVIPAKTAKKKSRKTQTVYCLKLETAPILITQYKPVESERRTAAENEKIISRWYDFMKEVNRLLTQAKVHEVIIEDIDLEKKDAERLQQIGANITITNNLVCYAMGELVCGEKFKLSKEQLKVFQDQTTIDLLECRRYLLNEFIHAYKITQSHSEAIAYALKFTKEHYKLDEAII